MCSKGAQPAAAEAARAGPPGAVLSSDPHKIPTPEIGACENPNPAEKPMHKCSNLTRRVRGGRRPKKAKGKKGRRREARDPRPTRVRWTTVSVSWGTWHIHATLSKVHVGHVAHKYLEVFAQTGGFNRAQSVSVRSPTRGPSQSTLRCCCWLLRRYAMVDSRPWHCVRVRG